MNNWVKAACGGNPGDIMPGYHLDGRPLATDYRSLCFTAPFAVSALVDSDHGWRDRIWNTVYTWGMTEYYQDSLKLYAWLAGENRLKGSAEPQMAF